MLAALSICGAGAAGANSAVGSAALVVATLICAGAILAMTKVDRRVRRAGLPVALAIMLLLSWTAMPAIVGGGLWRPAVQIAPERYALEYLKLVAAAMLFFAAVAVGLQRGLCRSVGGWIVLFGGLLLIAAVVVRSHAALTSWGLAAETGFHRFNGTIGNPNAAGCVYGMIALISVGYAFDRASAMSGLTRQALIAGLALLVAGSALVLVVLSQSRSAFVLTLLGLALLVAAQVMASRVRGTMRPQSWMLVVVGSVAVGVGLLLLASTVLDRLSIVHADGLARWAVLQHYAALALKAPLFGHGLGSFFDFNQRNLDANTALEYWNFGAAHNAALQFALEAGWPALGLLVLAGLLCAVRAVPALLFHEDAVGTGMILAIYVAIGCSSVDIALNVPGIAAFTVMLAGLCFGRSLRFRSSAHGDESRASLS